MKLLLDTHAFLWAIWGRNLSETAQDAYLDAHNELYLSAASYWEMCLKISIGKLTVIPDWIKRFDTEIVGNGIKWLSIEKEHCRQLTALPQLHRDPFDRLLIAQAQAEGMTLLTADANIQQYPISTLW